MSAASTSHVPTPLKVGFSSRISLTIHDAFLPAAGLLQCDPVAKVHVVTVKTLLDAPTATKTRAGAGLVSGSSGVRVTINSKEVGSTKRKLFTSHPVFNETLNFSVEESSCLTSLAGTAPATTAALVMQAAQQSGSSSAKIASVNDQETVQEYVVVTIEDANSGRFFGEAYCPFSPHCPSVAAAPSPVRVMLQPRNAQDPTDPLFQRDSRTLAAQHLDDFGFLSVSWRVRMVPHGGAVLIAPSAQLTAGSPPQFPLGLTLQTTWLAPQSSYQRGTQYTTAVEFGGADRFVFSNGKPLFLTIRSATQLERAIFHCCVQNVVKPEASHDVSVVLPLPSLATAMTLDRDVHWTAAVRTAQGDDLGMLLATLRLSRRALEGNTPVCPNAACLSINDPLHQEEFSHVVNDFGGRPLPDAPYGAYQPMYWESEEHISFATERRWKLNCLLEAQPTAEHVRHLFEVLMGRTQLDAGVASAAAGFFNRGPSELTAADLKEFMVGCAFHASGLTVQDAARFSFIALRRDVEDAVVAEEVHYLLTHSLVGKTVDMPRSELRRWVCDIFGDVRNISFDDFSSFFIHNYGMWGAFGIPLMVDLDTSSAQRRHHLLDQGAGTSGRYIDPTAVAAGPTSTVPPVSAGEAAPITTATAASSGGSRMLDNSASGSVAEASAWRTFVVRVENTKKGFSVTAHVNDTVRDVMSMLEGSTGIKAARQEWRVNGEKLLDPKANIGSTTLGLLSALKGTKAGSPTEQSTAHDVWVREQEESLLVSFVFKNKKWQERMLCSDKVLKMRSAAQRKTLIPLSRCVLRVKNSTTHAVTVLQDRHPISHYKLQSGDIVEVSQE